MSSPYDPAIGRLSSAAQAGPPYRNPDYDPYASQDHKPSWPQELPRSNPSNPYGPTEPAVVGGSPQHPGLARNPQSFQPPQNPEMGHPGMRRPSHSYGPSQSQQPYGTSPAQGYYGTSPAQGNYGTPPAVQGFQGTPPSSSHFRRQSQQTYPTYGSGQGQRDSYHEDGNGVTFDESTYDRETHAQRPRSYSTASGRSHRRSSGDRDRSRSRPGSRGSVGGGSRSSHDERRRLERLEQPRTFGDSMVWAWDKTRGLLSSRRD